VCRHSLAVHSSGSPADCLFYSLSLRDPQRTVEAAHGGTEDCGSRKFRLSRRTATIGRQAPRRAYLCHCDLIHETERQARNCVECAPKLVYLCITCSAPRADYTAALKCCSTSIKPEPQP